MTAAREQMNLEIWPDANLVSVTRRFIEDVYERVTTDYDVVSRIALTSHELLENAVKYSTGGMTRISIGFERGEAADFVLVRVWNQATEDGVVALRAALAEMEREANPFVYYQGLMRRNAKMEGSGLGLARICAEGEMVLRLEIQGDRICIAARGAIQKLSEAA